MSENKQVITLKDNDAFLTLLEEHALKVNTEPSKDWLKSTPDGKAKYIPVSIIENQLRQDYNGLVQYELLSERRELNEYIVTARVKVFHPIIMQWMSFDGIGSVVIMQDKDASLDSFNSTKKKNALQLNAPKAYAEALKNAAKKIGVKYGANINREADDAANYEPETLVNNAIDEAIPKMQNCTTLAELKDVWNLYPEFQKSNKFKIVFNQAKTKING